ncbi:hypothetical protein C7271_19940 [filamentous cyanobacterium CCP5]|nr:hypothetical protein C7271_19940 [filamentous cyanobacterium CCP5]
MIVQKLSQALLIGAALLAGTLLIFGDIDRRDRFETCLQSCPVNQTEPIKSAADRLLQNQLERLDLLGRLAPLKTPISLPFDYRDGYILVPLRLNQMTDPALFLLDSGAWASIVDRRLASTLPLLPEVELNPQTAYSLIRTIHLGEARFSQMGAIVAPFSAADQPLSCLSPNGVMGASFLHHGTWQINYRDRTLTLASNLNQLSHWQTARSLPFTLHHQTPVIPIELGNGVEIQAVVDTGWNGSVYLTHADARRSGNLSLAVKQVMATQVETLRGMEIQQLAMAQAPDLHVGGLPLGPMNIWVEQQPSAQSYSLLGSDVLEHFIVTLDWTGQRLFLKPISSLPSHSPITENYGFQALPRQQQLMITGLLTPSPIAQAGGRLGDQILAINGDDYRHMGQHQFCDLVINPVGARYSGPLEIKLKRGNQLLSITVVPASQP